MLFNSLDYALFLPTVFLLYWFVFNKSLKNQNSFLLFASYFFYACWDWRFLFLLLFSTLLDYFCAKKIEKSNSKKVWFWLSIIVNLGFLGFFKYYNFFIESFSDFISIFGFKINTWTLNIILPVGISFYTFHGLSYIIDVYKNKIKAEKNIVDYAVFVSFFPLLVAGPIERATHLLPQIKKKRFFDYSKATEGLRQILWGLFKKIVIADSCAEYVDIIFNNSNEYSGSTLLVGAILFAFQIYGDFSGYSDIALGSARLLGINLLKNFSYPYFSRDIAEFWRRWHISLSTWFRDYLYIPLGGSKGDYQQKIRNVFIIFLVSGFWHGANWTFIAWGFLNAVYILPSVLLKSNRKNLDIVAKGRNLPNFKELISIIITFLLTVLAWVFFRAESIQHAIGYISEIFSQSIFSIPEFKPKAIFLLVSILVFIEWTARENEFGLEKFGLSLQKSFRILFYYALALLIFYYVNKQQQFIYFQF